LAGTLLQPGTEEWNFVCFDMASAGRFLERFQNLVFVMDRIELHLPYVGWLTGRWAIAWPLWHGGTVARVARVA